MNHSMNMKQKLVRELQISNKRVLISYGIIAGVISVSYILEVLKQSLTIKYVLFCICYCIFLLYYRCLRIVIMMKPQK